MISVIVTTYNRADFLDDALRSVFEQDADFPQQVIICDDGSTDNTKDVIDKYTKKFWDSPHSIVIIRDNPTMEQRKNEVRYVKMINRALPFCKGKYITYLSDDDIYHQDRNRKMVEFLEANPDIYLAYHYMKIYKVGRKDKTQRHGDTEKKILWDLNHPWDEGLEYWIRNIWNYIDHCSFVHRNLYEKNILWNDDIKYMRCGDWGFLRKALAEGKKFTHVPEHLATGRKIEGQSINIDGVEKVLETNLTTKSGEKTQRCEG